MRVTFNRWKRLSLLIRALHLDTPAGGAAALILAVLVYWVWSADEIFIDLFYQDYFVGWNAGAKWAAGHVPSVDFPSALGPFYYLIEGVGFLSAGGRADAVAKANVWALAVTVPLMAAIVVPRFPAVFAALIMVFLGAWIISPRCEDFGPLTYSYVASYNRYGFVWMSLIMIAAAIPRKEGDLSAERIAIVDNVLIGVLLVFCVYTKVTFVLYAAPFLAVALYLRHRTNVMDLTRSALWMGVPALITIPFVEIFAPGFHFAYASDLLYTAGIQESGLFSHSLFQFHGWSRHFYLFELNLVVVFLFILSRRLPVTTYAVPAGMAVCALFLLGLANGQTHNSYVPVFSVALCILFGLLMVNRSGEEGEKISAFAKSPFTLLLVCAPLAFVLTLDVISILSHESRVTRHADAPTVNGFPSRGLYLDSADDEAAQMTAFFDDAEALIRAAEVEPGGVWCLGFSNPCPVLLGNAPPIGPLPWWHAGRSYSVDNPPGPEIVFAGVGTVLEAKDGVVPLSAELMAAYRDYLTNNYKMIGVSEFWVLWHRT